MVADTGETLRTGAYKPLNTPETIKVEEDATGQPQVIRGKRRLRIETIDDRWRIDDEWWRVEPVSRLYYAVHLSSGQRLEIYKDLITSTWYWQSY